LEGSAGAVKGVEVEARGAPLKEFPTLVSGVVDAKCDYRFGVGLNFFQLMEKRFLDFGSTEGGEPFYLADVGDRQNAGQNRKADPRLVGPLNETKIVRVMEKKLCYDKVRAGVHFAFEVV
jgi:hypothetical protein